MSKTRLWIVGATGFTQGWKSPTGLEVLWRELRGFSSAEVCVVTPLTWDGDAEGLAALIARNSAFDAEVIFYGHSYGVGEFFRRFAETLLGFDIPVSVAVFADGVRRFKALKPLSTRWFRSLFQIVVPGNVKTVYAFHQSNDPLIEGHDVVAWCPDSTAVHMIEQRLCTHSTSDEDPNFHRVVTQECAARISALNLN